MGMVEEKELAVEATPDHFLAGWKALQIMVNNEVPDTQAEIAFLMEIMGDIAKQIDARKSQTATFKMRMSYQKWRGIWHSIKVCLDNKLFNHVGREAMASTTMIYIAKSLDEANMMECPPEEVKGPHLRLVQ